MTKMMMIAMLVGGCAAPTTPLASRSTAVPLAASGQPSEPSEQDKTLVIGVRDPETTWTAPSGAKLAIAAKSRLAGKTYAVDLVVDGTVLATVETGVEPPNADGFHQYEPIAGVKAIPEGVVFVAGSVKVTGKAAETYDARVLHWDAAQSKLLVARTIAFSSAYDPAKDN